MPTDNINLIYILAGVGVILVLWIVRLEFRLARLLIGKNARTLEGTFISITKNIGELQKFTREMENYLGHVERRLKRSVQSIETTRFNPFKGTGSGGNQSFSAAFIDEQGNGLVLTTMYARDRISVFAKPLKAFTSEFDLSDEEKESIEKCQKQLLQK